MRKNRTEVSVMARSYGKYSELNLQKNDCLDCDKQFITGLEISNEIGMICPYCGSSNTVRIVHTDDDSIPEDMGCLSIMIETSRLDGSVEE